MRIVSKIVFLLWISLLISCNSADQIARIAIKKIKPKYAFTLDSVPAAPEYNNLNHWTYLPENTEKEADVFYIHPSSFFVNTNWNQPMDFKAINDLTYYVLFANQASAFLDIANVYAPIYRQANFYAFLDLQADGKKALDLAYQDIELAFDYYFKNFNQGRPFILAGHSQGSYLGEELLKYINKNKEMRDLFVTAYFIGWPVTAEYLDELESIPMCQNAEDIGCINSWNTQRSFALKSFAVDGIQVTNPLSWENKEVSVTKDKNLGALFIENPQFEFSQKSLFSGDLVFAEDYAKSNDTIIIPQYISASTEKGVVVVEKPSNQKDLVMFLKAGNYHLYDYNFFYFNIKENAQTRIREFLQKKK